MLATLVASALTGCIQGEVDAPVDTASALDKPTTSAGQLSEAVVAVAPIDMDVPVWNLGDAWEVKLYGFGDDKCTLPVVAVGSTYTLASTCERHAIGEILWDISYVGPIRADDLAGAQKGTAVRYYDFPLYDGKTWTTSWDGRDIKLTATAASNLRSPLGTSAGYHITGVDSSGAEYVRYDYSPDVKWFTHLDFAAGYGLTVEGFRTNWTGTYLTATGQMRVEAATPAAGALVDASTFNVGTESTHLVFLMSGSSPSYVYSLEIMAPDQSIPFRDAGGSPTFGDVFHQVVLPAMPGDWGMTVKTVYDPADGSTFFMRAYDIAIVEKTL